MKHGVYLMLQVEVPAMPVGPPLTLARLRGWSQPLLGLSFGDKERTPFRENLF